VAVGTDIVHAAVLLTAAGIAHVVAGNVDFGLAGNILIGSIPGVIGRKPIHLIRGEDRDKAPKIKDLHIDVGAADGDEARSIVRVGDVGVIDVQPLQLRNGRLVSRSLDNRIGSYVAAARQIDVQLLSGPFKHLINRWRFVEAPGGTKTAACSTP